MSVMTDPAREFTDFCQSIRGGKDTVGAEYLANHFDIPSWSTDFMILLASVHQRIEALKQMLSSSELDTDIKDMALTCLDGIRDAFSMVGLTNNWSHSVKNYLTDANLLPIRMASGYLRPKYGYSVPSDEELGEVMENVQTLLDWLRDAELTERDFIRCALIEGLETFLSRITHIGWFGWPNAFDSLKDVVAAYLALERGMPAANESPPYEAMVKKVGTLLQGVFDRIKLAKDVQEAGDWLLRGYGALQAVGHVSKPIAGLLTYSG